VKRVAFVEIAGYVEQIVVELWYVIAAQASRKRLRVTEDI
jgi:hypothetical protein